MSDIVDRLRSVTDLQRETERSSYEQDDQLALEAADTITRLTAEVEKLKADFAFVDAQCAKIEGLFLGAHKENEKLRAALEMFACDCAVHERCAVPDNCRNFQARAALSGGKP